MMDHLRSIAILTELWVNAALKTFHGKYLKEQVETYSIFAVPPHTAHVQSVNGP
jgi:hypothetical protein